jgi:hypothetical protein
MSFAELTKMQAVIERLKAEKQVSERSALKQKLETIAKEAGFDLREVFDGRSGRRGKGTVAVSIATRQGIRGPAGGGCRAGSSPLQKAERRRRKTSWSLSRDAKQASR